jgi:hypothetical protein
VYGVRDEPIEGVRGWLAFLLVLVILTALGVALVGVDWKQILHPEHPDVVHPAAPIEAPPAPSTRHPRTLDGCFSPSPPS